VNPRSDTTTRGEVLGRLLILPALAGLMAMGTGIAQAKGSKSQFKYQTTPNNHHQCSGCSFFIAGKSKTVPGTCKLVDGSISPTGWCEAYSPKT
jgi:hypothetical protein